MQEQLYRFGEVILREREEEREKMEILESGRGNKYLHKGLITCEKEEEGKTSLYPLHCLHIPGDGWSSSRCG